MFQMETSDGHKVSVRFQRPLVSHAVCVCLSNLFTMI